MSISFQRKREDPPPESFGELKEQQARKYKKFGSNFANGLYDVIVGLDPGYKLYIAAVVKNMRTNEEKHVKLSSKQFYSMTRQNYRDKKSKKWTNEHEAAAKLDREDVNEYSNYPSSVTSQYVNYIRHSMKFFRLGIEPQLENTAHIDKWCRKWSHSSVY